MSRNLENMLQGMQWPAQAEEGEEDPEGPQPPQRPPGGKVQPSLQNFPWLAFAQLLGGWITGTG